MSDGLPCVTLHQPYASLVALGVKSIETRSWPAPASLIGQRIGIHAAAKPPSDLSTTAPALYSALLLDRSIAWPNQWARGLPLGAIVATAVLTDCVPIVDDGTARNCVDVRIRDVRSSERGEDITDVRDQLPYGHFSPGRHAWLLSDVKPTTERCPACWGETTHYHRCPVCGEAGGCDPVPAKGRQRIWYWTPDAVPT